MKIRKVGIVGEGKMGAGIFNYLLDSGYDLVWVTSPEANTDKLSKQLLRKLSRSIEAGGSAHGLDEKMGKTIIVNNQAHLSQCDLIIEAIPENAELKRALFCQLDSVVNKACIFASNSSSINPSRMAPDSPRREKFCGIHFFYPVALMNIVEVIAADATSEETLNTISGFLQSIQRRELMLNERNGFIMNRLFLDIQNEAFNLVARGYCTFEQMDMLVKENLFSFGIFDFCDSVGNDIMLASVQNYLAGYADREYYRPFTARLSELCDNGRLGVKSRAGFYDYPPGPPAPTPLKNQEELISHMRFTWLNAAKRFTAQAHLPIGDMNDAVKEYFGLETGPFE